MPSLRIFLTLVLAAFVGIGCSESAKDVFNRYRPDLEKKFQAIQALDQTVGTLSPLTEDNIKKPDIPLGLFGWDDNWNTYIVYAEDLKDLGNLKELEIRVGFDPLLWNLYSALHSSQEPYGLAKMWEEQINKFLKTNFLCVLRDFNSQKAWTAVDPKSFYAGKIITEALIFDLRNGDYLGGFRFEAESSQSVRFQEGAAESAIKSDLQANAGAALATKFREVTRK